GGDKLVFVLLNVLEVNVSLTVRDLTRVRALLAARCGVFVPVRGRSVTICSVKWAVAVGS
ncbi:hypothetical protein, partial [Streptomyces niveus]|uniref:hypothetical protein n=1 Tax=Streptomyces niveus TaxID=193462 RepID=UPI0035DA1409